MSVQLRGMEAGVQARPVVLERVPPDTCHNPEGQVDHSLPRVYAASRWSWRDRAAPVTLLAQHKSLINISPSQVLYATEKSQGHR